MKKLTVLFLSILMLFSSTAVFASGDENVVIYDYDRELIEQDYNEQVENRIAELEAAEGSTNRQKRSRAYYSTEVVATKRVWSPWAVAGGQLREGTYLPANSYIYWSEGGGPTVSVSGSISGKIYGFGVSIGMGSPSRVSGFGIPVPYSGNWVLIARRLCEVKYTKIYRHENGRKVLWDDMVTHFVISQALDVKRP